MLLYVTLSMWRDRSYLLAVDFPLRDSVWRGGGGLFFLLYRSLAFLPRSAHGVVAVFILLEPELFF